MRYITLKHCLVAVWMKVQLDAARTSHLCGCQLRLQEHQGSHKNDKGFLMGRPVAPRPSGKHVGLDLTWLDAETCAVYTPGIMRYIGDDTNASEMIQVMSPLGRWDWGWGWGRCLEFEVCNGLKAWLYLIDNWSLINRMIRLLIVW